MKTIRSLNEMQSEAIRLRTSGKLIALVPTSGALHDGHKALVERANEEADIVVLSTLLNVKEFGLNEDYKQYPRTPEADESLAEKWRIDILFVPDPNTFYSPHHSVYVNETSSNEMMCGISRPHYFQGVCTAHTKLFNLVRPDIVTLGQRDPQKYTIIKKMVDELHFPIDVQLVDVVRGSDGLAYNSRLSYLNEFQLKDARHIYQSLKEGAKLVEGGIVNVDRVVAEVIHNISQIRRLRIIYVVAVDPETMAPRREIEIGNTLLVASLWCDEVRLIDCIKV